MADARLPDGSRVNVVIPPLAIDGPQLCIRRFVPAYPDFASLVAAGSLDAVQAEVLTEAVSKRESILISGGTSTGKTTLLAALLDLLPRDDRVVVVEDSAEIPANREHIVRLQARPAGLDGGGEVTIRSLIRNALRMRPDRVVVGEVRGAEAFDLVDALNTGHRGSMTTIHAGSAEGALTRLRNLVLMAGTGLIPEAIDAQVNAAVDLVVQLGRERGRRRVETVARAGPGGIEPV